MPSKNKEINQGKIKQGYLCGQYVTSNFKVMLVFLIKLFAGGNATSFDQYYAIKSTQNVHHFHPIRQTQ